MWRLDFQRPRRLPLEGAEMRIALDAVGLYYLCDEAKSRLLKWFFEHAYGEELCYLPEKGIKRYVGYITAQLNLGIPSECPYTAESCCFIKADEHESYEAICGYHEEDWIVAAIADCRHCDGVFEEGIKCESVSSSDCIAVVKCADLRSSCCTKQH